MLELEVLLADGSVVVCTADNEHRDLFFGFPNSYGTLGYALRVRTPDDPHQTVRRSDAHPAHRCACVFRADGRAVQCGRVDFLDGAVFAKDALYISVGRFVDERRTRATTRSSRSTIARSASASTIILTAADYFWRWDTDWFWCSKNLGAQNPWVRRLLGRSRLNSRFYPR